MRRLIFWSCILGTDRFLSYKGTLACGPGLSSVYPERGVDGLLDPGIPRRLSLLFNRSLIRSVKATAEH